MAVHVGSGDVKKVWHLPEDLVKSKSTFFTAALEVGWAEGVSKIITLPEEDPYIFEWFVVWLYTGYDPITECEIHDSLVPLWTLGDRLGCPSMQDDAMCHLIAHHSEFVIGEVPLKQIYEGSTRGSKIRQFVVDQCLFDVRKNYAAESGEMRSYFRFVKDNEDFAQELAEATLLLGNRDPKDPVDDKDPYLFAP